MFFDNLTVLFLIGLCTTTIMTYWKIVTLITCVNLSSSENVETQTNDDWWQHSVIYEIFPLSFKDSDSDGYGDFRG